MNHLATVPFDKVQKGEFPGLVKKVIFVVGKYDTSHFSELYNKLLSLKPELEKLEVDNKKHQNSDELKEQKNKLNKVVAGMYKHNKTVAATINSTTLSDTKMVLPIVERFLKNYTAVSPNSKLDRAEQMLVLVDSDEAVRGSLSNLNYNYYLNLIREILLQINHLDNERTADTATKPKYTDTMDAIKSLTVSMRWLFKEIEKAIYLNPDHDYSALVNELNTVFAFYRTPIKAKATRNNKAALLTKETAKIATTEKPATESQNSTISEPNKAA